jgi:4-diphosphocytidyl-2-C-methyl-D-erythritol kinase
MTSPALRRLLDVPAPAKLNLFLHITGRRNDGYHLLQSVFMLIDWCDRLDFEWRPDGAISRDDQGSLALPADDLCTRAARALQAATGCTQGAHITLRKHLPAEAGLGGGSSDAASTLLALNRLWGLGLKRAQLAEIGLRLGADVPFFIGGHNAWVEGIGEQMTPLSLPPGRFLVVKPTGGASTQKIFSAPALKRDTKPAILLCFAAHDTQNESSNAKEGKLEWRVDSIERLLAFGHNDLQPVAQALCPDVGNAIRWLDQQGWSGRMSGSGTAVFAHVPQVSDLPPLADVPAGWTARRCSNMDVHPLADWCGD